MSSVDVRRAATRPHTKMGWLDSWHSFSFGRHFDPANTHHGLLLVNNDDRVAPASGFPTHFHRDMEIVTWVLSGRLEHRDSEGNHGELYPGLAQRMSAGTGIEHSEMNPSQADEVHFVQMWVPPDSDGIPPSYEQRDINAELDKGGLRPIASGQGHDGAIAIHQHDAVLWGARLEPDEVTSIPDGAHVHLFVAAGDVDLRDTGVLAAGDAVRLSNAGDLALSAAPMGAEILVWVTS